MSFAAVGPNVAVPPNRESPETVRLLILGTRYLAIEIADLVSDMPGVELVGFVENLELEQCEKPLEGLPVHWIDDLTAQHRHCHAVCAISTTDRHQFVDQARDRGISFTTLVHPTARVSAKSKLGEGTVISPMCLIASHTRVGKHVFMNRGAMVGHHTQIGDYVTIQPGANIAGVCRIGERTYIGMGATVIDRITIGSQSIVGAGAVVTKDVPDRVQVIGVPARIVKHDIVAKSASHGTTHH